MKFSLMKIRLNGGWYTNRGEYFGIGSPLYRYRHDKWTHGGEVSNKITDFLRAENREDAKRQIREKWPKATFYGDKAPSPTIEDLAEYIRAHPHTPFQIRENVQRRDFTTREIQGLLEAGAERIATDCALACDIAWVLSH